MIQRFLKSILSVIAIPEIKIPTIKLLKISFSSPNITLPKVKIPVKQMTKTLGVVNTALLVLMGSFGLICSYINPIPTLAPYIQLSIANKLFDFVIYLQANIIPTISASSGLIVLGLLLHVGNFKAWWKTIKATPMVIVRSPIKAYRKITVWRNWLLVKIEYLNSESAKWKTAFKIVMSPYSFLRMMGLSPQMAIGLLALGGTAGTGVVVNETVLADRSFTNGDSGIYAAPALNPSPTLEQTMAWRKENKEDNTLRIVLTDTPVREIKIENVTVGTVYTGSAIPSSAHTSAGGTAAAATAVLIGGTVVTGENAVPTFLEVGELLIEKSRCTFMYFDNITAHTINVIGNASDGQSINQSPGTSRMRAVGGGHHQAEAMVTSGGSYDRIHIDAPTSSKNGKIDKLTLSNLFTEGGACVFDRMKIGTLTIKLNEIGGGGNAGAADGFATKEFKIAESVTAANWNVSDNVEVTIAAPTETVTNE